MELQPDALVASLLDAYALAPPVSLFPLEHAGLNNVNRGVRTGAGEYVLREYESLSYRDPASIEYEQAVLTWLAGQRLSFAVPVPLPMRDGRPTLQGPNGRLGLAPKLPGVPLMLEYRAGRLSGPAASELLGAATGELQAAMARHAPTDRPGRPLYAELFAFCRPRLDALTLRPEHVGLQPAADAALFGWLRAESAKLQPFVEGPYRALPVQLCHNDVTQNNVLVEDGTVTAVLDFEYVTTVPRALDFVTGLRMAMPYWQSPAPWAEARAYCRGFGRHVTLTEPEIAAIPDLLRLRSAITALWWIGRAGATGTAGPLVNRLERVKEIWDWLTVAEAPLMAVVRAALSDGVRQDEQA
jgi:Ser/Thr protein kinase RdoA (MazF antagonist)